MVPLYSLALAGLEASAEGGRGLGIFPFRPQRGPLTISANLTVPNIARVLQTDRVSATDVVAPAEAMPAEVPSRHWSDEERELAAGTSK